jgi:hypothetical protein
MLGLNLDKIQVARRQLGTALALFIDDFDPVSVHTLACAGGEIAEHLTRKVGGQPFVSHALETFPDLEIAELRRLQNQFWNAFKHATAHGGKDRADRELLERFNDLQNDHSLFVGWYDYMLAVGSMPVEAQAFQAWYFALYPEKLDPNLDKSKYETLFPNLRDLSRKQQKSALRDAIAYARSNTAIMADKRTDTSPLILGG